MEVNLNITQVMELWQECRKQVCVVVGSCFKVLKEVWPSNKNRSGFESLTGRCMKNRLKEKHQNLYLVMLQPSSRARQRDNIGSNVHFTPMGIAIQGWCSQYFTVFYKSWTYSFWCLPCWFSGFHLPDFFLLFLFSNLNDLLLRLLSYNFLLDKVFGWWWVRI